MANLSLIRDLCAEKRITLKELADAISISQNGLQRIIKDNSTRIETLEKIADYFNVPIVEFFRPEDSNEVFDFSWDPKLENEQLKIRISELEEQLEDKRTILNMLKETGAISGYNLAAPKEERGVDYNLDFHDPNVLLKELTKRSFDFNNEEEKWKWIEKEIAKKKLKISKEE